MFHFNFALDYARSVKKIGMVVTHLPGKLQNGNVPKTPDAIEAVCDEVFTYLWLTRLKKEDGTYEGDVCFAICLTMFEVFHHDPFEIAMDANIINQTDLKEFYASDTWKNLQPKWESVQGRKINY
mgnify:CR=1 FL=1